MSKVKNPAKPDKSSAVSRKRTVGSFSERSLGTGKSAHTAKRLESPAELNALQAKLMEQRDPSKPCIAVCCTGCAASGAGAVIETFRKELKNKHLDQKVDIRATGCHGFCECGPIAVIFPKKIFYQKIEPTDVPEIVTETIGKGNVINRLLYTEPETGKKIITEDEVPFYEKQLRILSRYNNLIDPVRIEDYIAIGGYSALGKVLSQMKPEDVITQIMQSGLRGRGGAGFSTGSKWEYCRKSPGDTKYIICNADEGDPGAFMNRGVLEGNPHSVLEGMLIGAYAIGAAQGVLYIRSEYPLAVKHVKIALEAAQAYGLLGKNILGSKFSLDLQISQGAGSFVCGEETALIASIEGRRGEPRQRPPFPAQKGLWGKPTNINNVETWANVPLIINNGAAWFTKIGTEKSKGTKIFSLVGKINNTGLVEVPLGTPLGEVVFDIGGGIPKGRAFKAVQTGGPSGGCIPSNMVNLPIDYERLAEAGSIIGSGGIIVMDENTCMVDIAKYFLTFLEDESCGKCYPCRKGIQRMREIITDITQGRAKPSDIELLKELGQTVKDTTMCGLGQTAANPVLSTLRYFQHEYEDHITKKKCSAAVCMELVSSPCQHTCPMGTEVPVYIALIAHGKFKEAYDIIRKDNPLPSVCGRVCSHPCELKCRAGETGDPIAIRALKKFAADYALRHNYDPPFDKAAKKQSSKIAIIGSGPAGLAAAWSLACKGYSVTIFEAMPVAGGILAVSIPSYRLPKDVLNKDIESIKKLGVAIKTNTRLGKDISLRGLKADGFKAIFIATGAHNSKQLGIEGESAQGVLDAHDFLKKVTLGKKMSIGQRIGVIGGGNVSIDAARVAARLSPGGTVTIFYRRNRAGMPAIKEEITGALEEGIKFKFLSAPKKLVIQDDRLTGLECIKMQLGEVDKSGRRKPLPITGSEYTTRLDTLLVAVGEEPDTFFMTDSFKKLVAPSKTIIVDRETMATEEPGIFAGGDVVYGPSTVIEAMASGKIAAESIDQYLSDRPIKREYTLTRPSKYIDALEISEEEMLAARRALVRRIDVSQRINNFDEIVTVLSEKDARKEARRCMRCELGLLKPPESKTTSKYSTGISGDRTSTP